MPDRPCGPGGQSARPGPRDQAAGLRRLFAPLEPHWLPILLATERDPAQAGWLATLVRACVEQGARTLVVDAARAQVAAGFGLRLRYDLAHALKGDCLPSEACVQANENLRILPAARALEQRGPDAARRFEAGVRALAAGADCALLLLPALRGAVLAGFSGPAGYPDAVVLAGAGPQSIPRVMDTIRRALSAADIDTFRLLFQGMDPVCAGRLYSRLALAGARELGARTADAGSLDDPLAIRRLVRLVRCRSTPTGERARSVERGTAVETVS
jgi:hypothetical protein